jgi:hypothetical protein
MSTDASIVLSNFASLPFADQQIVAAEIARLAGGLRSNESTEISVDQPVEPEVDGLLPYEQWIVEFRKWGRSHTKHNPNVDASRDSIYD